MPMSDREARALARATVAKPPGPSASAGRPAAGGAGRAEKPATMAEISAALDAKLDPLREEFSQGIREITQQLREEVAQLQTRVAAQDAALAARDAALAERDAEIEKLKQAAAAATVQAAAAAEEAKQCKEDIIELRTDQHKLKEKIDKAGSSGAAPAPRGAQQFPPPPAGVVHGAAKDVRRICADRLLTLKIRGLKLPPGVADGAAGQTAWQLLKARVQQLEGDALKIALLARAGDSADLRVELATPAQRQAIYAAKSALVGGADGVAAGIDVQRTPGEHHRIGLLRLDPGFKAAVAAQIELKEKKERWTVSWMPHGCIVGTEFWEYVGEPARGGGAGEAAGPSYAAAARAGRRQA